jgi:uncharacterized integral membrane protein (TIGR00698 family)
VPTVAAARRRLPAPPGPATVPGLAVVAALVLAGLLLAGVLPVAGPLLWAMGLGILAAPLVRRLPAARPGVRLAAGPLLRAGVALLGLRVSLGELATIGPRGLGLAATVIAVTMLGTTWLGRRLRVPAGLALLIATGSAICGASAIAAMNAVARAREEDVGYAVATVTLFGTVAIAALPAAAHVLGLTPEQAGLWAGASIHEVAQVAAAGAAISPLALKVATLTKLARVVLLAPSVALVAARRGGSAGDGGRGAGAGARVRVPAFVLAFLALVAARSLLPLPAGAIDAATLVSTTLLASGLAALGLGVHVAALRRSGLRPLALGLAAWLLAAATGLGLVLATS